MSGGGMGGMATEPSAGTPIVRTTNVGEPFLDGHTFETAYLKAPVYLSRHLQNAGYQIHNHGFEGIVVYAAPEGGHLLLQVTPIKDGYSNPIGPNEPTGYKVVIGFSNVPGAKRSELEKILTELTQL